MSHSRLCPTGTGSLWKIWGEILDFRRVCVAAWRHGRNPESTPRPLSLLGLLHEGPE